MQGLETERQRVERATTDGSNASPRDRRGLSPTTVFPRNFEDPWALLEDARSEPAWFAWHDGERETTLLGWGAAATFEAVGPGRFRGAERWYSQLREQRVEPSGLPFAVGGFAFEDDAVAGAPWPAWPAAWLFVPQVLLFSTANDRGFVLRAVRPRALARRLDAALEAAAPPRENVAAPQLWRDEPSRDAWEGDVQRALNDIAAGCVEKLVLARRRTLSTPAPLDPLATLRLLRARQPRATTFALGRGDAVFLGATPETLAAVAGGELRTAALAGTAPAGERAALVESAKDRHEHALVVDDIAAALAPLASELCVAPGPELRDAGAIVHLATPITARLAAGATLLGVAERLHPTAALCGSPRAAARGLLGRREAARGWFGGPLGWLDADGGGVFSVAIRSALLAGTTATAFAGAGLVRGSQPRAEWDETARKLETLAASLRCAAEAGP